MRKTYIREAHERDFSEDKILYFKEKKKCLSFLCLAYSISLNVETSIGEVRQFYFVQ